ncbi:hypothetical protein [Citrobacter freundii]|uniref:hypothetical protein n=1 Tax=Citrobacter freundii TaxID=546 RepID=UPI00397D122C
MANWWMPVAQLRLMRRMAAGEKLVRDVRTRRYFFANGDSVTSSARSLAGKGLISEGRASKYEIQMSITPTGKNELGYNRHREID